MRRALLLAIFLTVAPVAQAGGAPAAGTVLYHHGHVVSPQPYRRWLEGFFMPQPPGYVDFSIGDCESPFMLGCMDWSGSNATVVISRGWLPATRFTFAHEMGHVFDMYVVVPSGYRPRFSALWGQSWQTPRDEERLADSYAACATERHLKTRESYDLRLTPALFAASCRLFEQAYAAWLALPAHPYGQASPFAAPQPPPTPAPQTP